MSSENLFVALLGINKQDHLLQLLNRVSIEWDTAGRGESIDCQGKNRIFKLGSTHNLINVGEDALYLNRTDAIHACYNKAGFRAQIMADSVGDFNRPDDVKVPFTTTDFHDDFDLDIPYIARPNNHTQGRNLYTVRNRRDEATLIRDNPEREGWYYSELIDKDAEYRIYMFRGGIMAVFNKEPIDRTAVYWGGENSNWTNVRIDSIPQGRTFYNIAEWVYRAMEIDLCAIDVITQGDETYVLEANTCFECQGRWMARKTIQVITEWAGNDGVEHIGEYIRNA